MTSSKLWMVLGGGLAVAISVIALWRFSLPNWGMGLAMLGAVLGFSAMATPFVPEQPGNSEPGGDDGGADTPEAEASGSSDSGGGSDGGGGGDS